MRGGTISCIRQAECIRQGDTMHGQLDFPAYLDRRAQDPVLTFWAHLRVMGGAIEE